MSNWRRILEKLFILYYFRHHLALNITNNFCEAEYLVWQTDLVKHTEANSGIFGAIFLRQAFFIPIFIRIFYRELHNHSSCSSDNLSSQKHILQTECLDVMNMLAVDESENELPNTIKSKPFLHSVVKMVGAQS